MTRGEFHHGMRVLLSLEPGDLRGIGLEMHEIQRFYANPLLYFLKCGDAVCDALWAIVERRLNGSAP